MCITSLYFFPLIINTLTCFFKIKEIQDNRIAIYLPWNEVGFLN